MLLQLVMEVLKKLEGAYALLIKSRHYPGELVACKRGSPMIVGIKEGQPGQSCSCHAMLDVSCTAALPAWYQHKAHIVVAAEATYCAAVQNQAIMS